MATLPPAYCLRSLVIGNFSASGMKGRQVTGNPALQEVRSHKNRDLSAEIPSGYPTIYPKQTGTVQPSPGRS